VAQELARPFTHERSVLGDDTALALLIADLGR
jgi:hypothetical protein